MTAPTSGSGSAARGRASGSGTTVPSSSLSDAPSSSMAPLSSMTPSRPGVAQKRQRTSLVAPAFEGRQFAPPASPQMPAASPSRGGPASQQASPMGISSHVLSQASLLAAVGSSQSGRRGESSAVRRSPAGVPGVHGAAPPRLAPPSSPSPRAVSGGAPAASPRPLMALSALQPVRLVAEPPPPPPPLPRRSASPTRRQVSLSVQAAHMQPAAAEQANSERQLAAAAALAAAPSQRTPLPAVESLLMPAPAVVEPPAALPPPVPPAETPHASPALPASLSSPALPRPPTAPSRHVPRERLSTHLPSLDALLAPLPFPTALRPYSADEQRRIGLRPGGALEIAGPPGSGKTVLAVAAAVRCRLDSLRRVRARLRARSEGEADDASPDTWESAAKTAEQVWLLDTEGALIAARLRQAAVSQVAALPESEVIESSLAADGDVVMDGASSADADADASRKGLLRAVLQGLHISRVLSLAALLAHFFLAFPPTIAAPYAGRLPARCALIVIDTLSSPLRFPPGDTSAQRTARTQAFASIASFAARARAANVAVLATNQMASKMFAPGGVLSNFRNPDAIARLVPQLLAPLVLGVDAEEMQIVPRDEAEAAWLYAERGSALGKETNRVTLFRAGPRSQTFAQMVGRPASQPMPPRAAPLIKPEPDAEPAEPAVPELGWRTWIPFAIDDNGTPFELPDEEPSLAAG